VSERILVTGGAGFIGSHLVERLLARDCAVTVLDDLSSGSERNLAAVRRHPDLELRIGSVLDAALVEHLVSRCGVIVHLAAAVGVDAVVQDTGRVLETQLRGSLNVMGAAARLQRRLLFASSSEVYGKSADLPLREGGDRTLGPTQASRWSYATAKAASEYLALAHHARGELSAIVVRFFNTIGPRQSGRYGMVVPRFVRRCLDGEVLQVHGDGRQRRCFCDVRDTVRALVALLEQPKALGQVVNVGGTREIGVLELARRVLSLAGVPRAQRDYRIEFVPYAKVFGEGFEDTRRRLPDVSRIRALTGWRPSISLDETLSGLLAEGRGRSSS
jgi:UDP-glucose 4-epimerase